MKPNNKIKVSICCTAYNHEKYIEATLKSFLAQITNFQFEIIIHDDASTDKTAEIIRLYEERYPKIIHAIYQCANQYSKGIKITQKFIAPKTKGEYIALCEGDDFWTDPYKLQKQVDMLENNKNSFFCVHRTEEINENGTRTGIIFPKNNIKTSVILSENFLKMTKTYSFHTSSYLFNGDKWREYQKKSPKFKTVCLVGDEPYMLYFAQLGDVCYLSETMSCYRRGVPSSWSKMQNSGDIIGKKCRNVKNMAYVIKLYDEYTHYKYHNICMLRYAYYLKTAWLLEEKTKQAITSQYRYLFSLFSLKHKILLIIACVFPRIAKKIYVYKILKANESKGY